LYFAIHLLNGRPWWRQLLTTMQISQVTGIQGSTVAAFFDARNPAFSNSPLPPPPPLSLLPPASSAFSIQFVFDIVLCVYAFLHVFLNGQLMFGSLQMECHGTRLGAFFGNFVLARCERHRAVALMPGFTRSQHVCDATPRNSRCIAFNSYLVLFLRFYKKN
jgi:hypothetical protein